MQELYQVERTFADETVEIRRVCRQAESVPLLHRIATDRDALAATVLPKSPLGEAVARGARHVTFGQPVPDPQAMCIVCVT